MDNTISSQSSELDELIKKYSPFIAEIRKRMIITLSVFGIATVGGFFFYEQIIKFLIEALSLKGINIVFTSPFQFINLAISCGLATGLVAVFPLLIFQVLSFLKPALRRNEFRMVTHFLPFSIALFIVGFLFGIFVMKWQIQLFLTKSVSLGIGNMLDISKLLSTVVLVSSVMGLAFQFPIVILLLTRLGIVHHNHLTKFRFWVYLGSFLFVLLLPQDSILADVLLALPLIALYEISILINRVLEKKKRRKLANFP